MSSDRDRVIEAVDRADLDELVRVVDGLCSERDWDGVVLLRDRCRHALERGLQLWPADEYGEYRLALHAPAEYAGPVVVVGAGRFALGPLWEVAASTHDWADLAPHLPEGPARAMAAHERVMRGEDLQGDETIDRNVLDLPLVLVPGEPAYPAAVYRADQADFPTLPGPRLASVPLAAPGEVLDDEESVEALLDLGRVWAEQSNGSVAAVAVDGTAEAAIAALGHQEVLAADIDGTAALGAMAWAGAGGGAYGRRRGNPAGRFTAWWAVAALAGLEWPPPPEELAAALEAVRWVWWEPPDFTAGWGLHLAVEIPDEGIAFAVAAVDSHREEDEESAGDQS